MVYPRRRCGGSHRNSRVTRPCISRGRRIETQGTGCSEKEVVELIPSRALLSDCCRYRPAHFVRRKVVPNLSSIQSSGLPIVSQSAKTRCFKRQPAVIPVAKCRLCICLEL